jgi:CheY-like chemotaxis protein
MPVLRDEFCSFTDRAFVRGVVRWSEHVAAGDERGLNMRTQPAETVLVVEDEALIRLAIADDLREAGFHVLEASDSDAAVRLLEAHDSVRLIFTDINMPGSMDGLKLSELVRDRWPPVRIIVTSGRVEPTAGALPDGSQFIAKPYAAAGVLEAVRSLLA